MYANILLEAKNVCMFVSVLGRLFLNTCGTTVQVVMISGKPPSLPRIWKSYGNGMVGNEMSDQKPPG